MVLTEEERGWEGIPVPSPPPVVLERVRKDAEDRGGIPRTWHRQRATAEPVARRHRKRVR